MGKLIRWSRCEGNFGGPLALKACFAVVVACTTVLSGAERAELTGVDVRIGPAEATISNGLLRLKISFETTAAGLTIVEDPRTGATLTLKGDPFVLEFKDGESVRSQDMQLIEATAEDDPLSSRLRLQYRWKHLRAQLVTELRAGQTWATRWLEMRAEQPPAEAERRRLVAVSLAKWRHEQAVGPSGPGETIATLGYPSGCGQVVYAGNFFCAIAHPGAENFAVDGLISCRIPIAEELGPIPVRTRALVLGVGSRRGFQQYIDATRAVKARMIFLVNDWYWKDKSRPLAAIEALANIKHLSDLPVDSFTLDDGWDFDWDAETGIWGRLNRSRFPGGWNALQAAGHSANINISLWFGPIGGYSYRPKRIGFARTVGYEIQADKLCLAGPKYRQHVMDSFSRWAERGMDYIKVDGFWPDCPAADHGHAVGPAGPIAQMDALMEVFAAWRRARPNLLIGYTSGSNPSPFWLQHADYLWRGGLDDSHAGTGEPFDRHNTYLDICLARHRQIDVPMSYFVTFDIVSDRIKGNRPEAFARGCWWLAARTSLHHDWYIQADDLTLDQWKLLAQAARWAKRHEGVFRWSRMVGGSPAEGEVYGFSAFDGRGGTLALRNPSSGTRAIKSSLASLLDLTDAQRNRQLTLRGVFGQTGPLEGARAATAPIALELAPLSIAVFEVEAASETAE